MCMDFLDKENKFIIYYFKIYLSFVLQVWPIHGIRRYTSIP